MFVTPGTRAGRGESLGFLSKAFDRMFGSAKGTLLVRGNAGWRKFLPGSNGQLIVSDSTQDLGVKWANGPTSAGITVGLDKDRPTAANGSIYLATDSQIVYVSDGSSNWYIGGNWSDKVGLGAFTDSNYLQGLFTGATVAPTMTNPYTVVIFYKIISLPGTTGPAFMCNIKTSFTDGWYLAGSTVNSNKMVFAMAGVNASAKNEFTNFTLTTGAHATAVSYDGSNIKMVHDGSAAQTIAASGSFTAPASTARFFIGRFVTAGFSFPGMVCAAVYGYSSALSTADMQTLTANPSTYVAGNISTAPAWVFLAKIPTSGTSIRTWGSAVNSDGTSWLTEVGTPQAYAL